MATSAECKAAGAPAGTRASKKTRDWELAGKERFDDNKITDAATEADDVTMPPGTGSTDKNLCCQQVYKSYFSTVAKPLHVELPNDVVDLVDWGSEVIGWRGRMTAKTYADALEEGGAVYLHIVAAANQRADRDGDPQVTDFVSYCSAVLGSQGMRRFKGKEGKDSGFDRQAHRVKQGKK